jgi:hypothetical protein
MPQPETGITDSHRNDHSMRLQSNCKNKSRVYNKEITLQLPGLIRGIQPLGARSLENKSGSDDGLLQHATVAHRA